MDEIILKFKADQASLDASFQELSKTADKAIEGLENKPIKLNITNADQLTKTLKEIANQGDAAFKGLSNGVDDVVNDVGKLKSFVENLTKSLQGVKQGSQEFHILEEIIRASNNQIKTLESNTNKAGASLRTQMRQAQQEVAELSAKFGATSKEAIEAAKRAAELKDVIGDAKTLTDAFNPNAKFAALSGSIQGVASGFQAAQGLIGAFGTESKEVEAALLKVNSAMALSQGLQGLFSSIDSFKNLGAVIKSQVITAFTTLRGAIAATGIGLLAIAIGLIVSNWEELVGWIEETFPAMKKVTDFFKNFRQVAAGTIQSIVTGFKVLGDVIGKIFKGDFSGAFASAKTIGDSMAKAYSEGFAKKDKELKEAALSEDKKHGKAKVKVAKDNNKDLLAEQERAAKELQKLQDDIRNNDLKEAQKLQDEIENVGKSDIDKKIQDINDEYFYKIEKAKQYGLDFVKLETERDRKIGEIEAERDKKTKENIDSIGKSLGDAYTRGYQTAEEYQAELFEKQKSDLNELLTFAQNGILLQLGLNPQDVERVKTGVLSAMDTIKASQKILDDVNATAAEQSKARMENIKAVSEVVASGVTTISNALFSAEKERIAEETQALNEQQEEEIRLAGDNEQKKDIIRQKYDLKKRELKRKEAEADKRKAIFDATVGTAVAVIQAGIVTPQAILAAILGGIQIALIAAQPIPKFAEGGRPKDGLQKGRPHSAGGILGEFEGDEFITKKSQAIKPENLGLLEAINTSDELRDRYINSHYVLPAIKKLESNEKQSQQASILEYENNLIARVSSATLRNIHGELKNNTEAVKRLANKDMKW